MWADAARSFGHPMIVVFGVEMNGTWFPWSGAYYGGAQWDKDQNNWKGPETFRKHFATSWIACGRAALQISNGCFTRTIIPIRTKPGIARPLTIPDPIMSIGSGLSVYGQQYKDEPNPDIPSLVNWPYEEICQTRSA